MRTGQYLDILTYNFFLSIFISFPSCHSARVALHHIGPEKVYGTSKPLENLFNDYEKFKEKMGDS